MNFDAVAYLTQLDNAPAVIGAVLAITYLVGRFGLGGNKQLAFAVALGLLGGGGLQVAELGMPADFAGWFYLGVYSLVMAATPSLLYEQGKEMIAKTIAGFYAKANQNFNPPQ